MTETADRRRGHELPGFAELRPGAAAARRALLAVRAIPAVLAEHAPIAAITAGGLVLRVLALAAVRPAIYFYGDSFSYIVGARQLVPEPTRPLLYPLFLRILGAGAAHIEPIVVVQHLMGLAIGLMLYALMRRMGVGRWLAAFGAAPVLLDGFQVNIEHQVMAETLFATLIVGAAFALMWRGRPSPAACAAAGLMIAGAALTRSTGIVLILPAILFVAVKRLGRLRLGALAGAFAVPALAYASWFASVNGSFALGKFDGHFLYGLVAPIADCTTLEVPAYEQRLCDLRPPAARPSADFYVWDGKSPIRGVEPPPGQTIDDVLRDFSLRVITQQPGRYLAATSGIFLHFFHPGRYTGRLDFGFGPWLFGMVHPDHKRVHNAILDLGPPYTEPSVSAGPVHALRAYQRYGYTWGPVLAFGLLAGALGAAGLRKGRKLRAESLFFATAGLLMLLVPALTVMFDYRYALPSLVLLPPAGAIGAHVLARRIPEWRTAPRPVAGSSPGRLWRVRWRMVNKLIPEGLRAGRILDVGCGADAGFLRSTEFAAKVGADRTAGRHRGIAVVRTDPGGELPFAAGSFDVVTAIGVFGRTGDHESAELLRSIRRVLKPGGRLVLTTQAPRTALVLDLAARLRRRPDGGQPFARSAREVRDLLSRNVFRRTEVRSGSFGLGTNVWAVAVKRGGGSGLFLRGDSPDAGHSKRAGERDKRERGDDRGDALA